MSSKGVNKVILIGNLGKDPEVKYFPNGDARTSMTVATSESWKDKQTGEMQTRTEWHKVVLNKKIAEIAATFLKKGSKVYVEGSLRTRSYDKDGQKHYSTEIIGENIQFLDGRPAEDRVTDRQEPAQSGYAGQRPARQAPSPSDFDDQIPF